MSYRSHFSQRLFPIHVFSQCLFVLRHRTRWRSPANFGEKLRTPTPCLKSPNLWSCLDETLGGWVGTGVTTMKTIIFEGSNMNILRYLLWGSKKGEVTCTYLYFLSIFLNILLVVALCFENAERNLFLSSNHHFSQGGMWILRGM